MNPIILLAFIGLAAAANHPQCGTKGPKTLSGRIIGGQAANPHEWPWQGSLQIKKPGGATYNHTCGCSLLNEEWVLTAAHCVHTGEEARAGDFRVAFGKHDMRLKETSEQISETAKIIHHPNWNNPKMNNDVAVIKLKTKMDLSKPGIGTICIPDKEPVDKILDYSPCVSTGWGLTKSGNKQIPPILQKVNVKIHDQESCKSSYSMAGLQISDGMVCIGESGKGVCNGDSGGPLNCKVGQKWYSYGATSFGVIGCHMLPIPSVYARTSYYSEWIWRNIAANANTTSF